MDVQKPELWKHAVDWACRGSKVILVLPYMNLENAITRIAEDLGIKQHPNFKKVASVLQMGLGFKFIKGLESKTQMAFELFFNTKEISKLIEDQNWNEVFKNMNHSGMRTFNQSLLQLMLNRKIDFKRVFSESPEPQRARYDAKKSRILIKRIFNAKVHLSSKSS